MKPFQFTALLLSAVLVASPAVPNARYGVTYSGGSVPSLKPGEGLRLFLQSDGIRLDRKGEMALSLKASSITEISYDQEAHRRVGAAVATAVFSLGIGIIVAFSKTKKHYIGLVWADGESKGGLVLQADKNEFRGILAGLEGMTGRRAIGKDDDGAAPTAHSTGFGVQPKPEQVLATITVNSTPSDATVEVDGYVAGRTPVDVKLPRGEYTFKVAKAGYRPSSQKITVEPGKAQAVGVSLAEAK